MKGSTRVRYPRGWGTVTNDDATDYRVRWDDGSYSWVRKKAALEVL